MKDMRNTAFLCMAAILCPAVFAACASDIPQSPGNTGDISDTIIDNNGGGPEPDSVPDLGEKIFRLTVHASAQNSEPRVSVDENSFGNAQNIVRWDAGDEIMVWTGNGPASLTACRFRTEKGGNTSAVFTCTADRPVESTFYLGYYPYGGSLSPDQPVPVSVPTDGSIIQTSDNDSRHVSSYRPMFTRPVVRAESDSLLTGLKFEQLTSLFVFRIMNVSGETKSLQAVTVRADKPVFHPEGTFRLPLYPEEESDSQVIPSASVGHTTLTFGGESFTAGHGETVTGYLPLLPSAGLEGVNLTVGLKAGGRIYESLRIDGSQVGQFRQGYFYVFYLRLNEMSLTVEPNLEAWEEGETVQIPL